MCIRFYYKFMDMYVLVCMYVCVPVKVNAIVSMVCALEKASMRHEISSLS